LCDRAELLLLVQNPFAWVEFTDAEGRLSLIGASLLTVGLSSRGGRSVHLPTDL
jgi:hypothetical protein